MPTAAMSNPLTSPSAPKKRYVRAVGPRLRILLWVVFGLFALLGVPLRAGLAEALADPRWWSAAEWDTWLRRLEPSGPAA